MAIIYRKLDAASHEFRLLEVQPAPDVNTPIEARLVTARPSANLQYIAISSLYGETNETEKILVNGRTVVLPAHLASALRHVRAVFFPTVTQRFQRQPMPRPRSTPRWLKQLFGLDSRGGDGSSSSSSSSAAGGGSGSGKLGGNGVLRIWIDIICVNQNSDQEKSHQRSTIREIYGNAELVVGWLGEKTEHTELGMRTLCEIDDAIPINWGDPGDQEKHPEDYAPEHRWARAIKHYWQTGPDGDIPFMHPHWLGANDFMHRPYFQRRWLLEEISFAKYPAFLIGDIIVPWKQVLRINRLMEEFKYHPSEVFPAELGAMIASLPLETAHKLLDEFALKQSREDAKILSEAGSRTTSSSTSNR